MLMSEFGEKLLLSVNASNAINVLITPTEIACMLTFMEMFTKNPNTHALNIAILILTRSLIS